MIRVGNPDNNNIYDSLMFSIKDELLKSFLATADIKIPRIEGEIKTGVYPMNECLVEFAYQVHLSGEKYFLLSLPLIIACQVISLYRLFMIS